MSAWALVGSPNSGKTTLYNWLTGARSKAVNYPGATVEYSQGSLRAGLAEKFKLENLEIIDTPGVYSFHPQSEDEQVTHNVLFSTSNKIQLNGLIVVVDSTQLNRHLMLVQQIKNSGYPVIVVMTMLDVLEKNKQQIKMDQLIEHFQVSFVAFDGSLGRGLSQILDTINKLQAIHPIEKQKSICIPTPWTQAEFEFESNQIQKVVANSFADGSQAIQSLEEVTFKLDKLLLHPIFGFFFFFLFMTLLFASVYWLAQPVMELIDKAFSVMVDFVIALIPGLWGEFLGHGLLAAIGGVLVFVPQIFILFLGIGFLESSGYLARVAALIDKPLAMVGLGGRSFVPLLSGFACAIPAIMATRNITSKKEKLIAQSIIPLMTCSARLPVYGLMIGFLFGDENPIKAGFGMALLYLSALVLGALASSVLSRFVFVEKSPPRLMMELPPYRRPRFRILIQQALAKAKTFSLRAGPIILVLALLLWFGTNFPRPQEGVEMTASQIATQSYAADFGKIIEPVFKPMGIDWRVGFGLISAFAAREVFVSTLALVFQVSEDSDSSKGLLQAMRQAQFPDGSPIFTTASIVGVLIFFMIALQCISTLGILRRETGSWKPALYQLILSNGLGYLLAVGAVQFLKAFGL